MRWNPLARSDPSDAEGCGGDDAESGAGTADLNRQPSYSRGGGEIHSHNLHDVSAFSNQPARRNRKRCMIETGIVAACAIALVIGLSVHYGQQKAAVSGVLWSDEPVETEPSQNDAGNAGSPVPVGVNPPNFDHDMDDSKEHAQEDEDEGPLLPPGMDPGSNLRPAGDGGGGNMTAEDIIRGEEIRTALNVYTPSDVLDDPATPQARAHWWISYEDPQRLTELNATFRQRYVLATLFYSTAGRVNGTGAVLQGWLEGSSECTWSGITCGGEFVVNEDNTFGLFLDDGTGIFTDATGAGAGVEGEGGGHREAPPVNAQEERGNKDNNQKKKKRMGGENNETAGTEDVLGEGRPVMAIDLGGLGLGGILPDEVGALLSLESFDMSFNDLEGPMPFTFGLLENLVILRLNNNRLEGPIPGTIGDLKSLEELYLHNNRFSGPIPQALGSVTALEVVHLNNNSLDGNIPESFGGLNQLRELEFGYNNLSGAVPLPICDLALADFGVDYQHSLPQVECSCCVGGEEEPPSSPAPPLPSDENGTDVGAEPGNETSNEGVVPLSASTWSQIGSDVFGTSDGSLFGSKVSMSGDGMRFAVGSVEYETDGFRSSTEVASLGVINVYEYLIAAGSNASSGVWTQIGPAIEVDSVHFYMSLSGDGRRVAVGWAPQDSSDGVVRVYEFQEGGDEWTQLGGNITSNFAYSLVGPVSLSNDGNRVAVGSPLFEGDRGRVDVYDYASGSWTMVGVGVEGGDAGANLGSSVSLSGSGDIVAVGGPKTPVNDATGGTVSIYRIDEDWAQQGSDIVGEDPNFGQSVSIAEDGIIVAVGAPSVDESDMTGGKVRVYRYDGSAWMQYVTVIEGSQVGSSFGSSVALSAGGEAVVVGSPGDASSDTAGHTSVYDIQDGIWTLRSALNGTEPGDNMGYSVSTSADGGLAVSGAPMLDSDGRGYVRVEGYMEAFA